MEDEYKSRTAMKVQKTAMDIDLNDERSWTRHEIRQRDDRSQQRCEICHLVQGR